VNSRFKIVLMVIMHRKMKIRLRFIIAIRGRRREGILILVIIKKIVICISKAGYVVFLRMARIS